MPDKKLEFLGHTFDADVEVIDSVNTAPGDLAALADLPRLRELRLGWTDPHRRPITLPMT